MPKKIDNYILPYIQRWLLRATVGLYTVDWLGIPKVIGSAVCVECRAGFSLFTAAHVLSSDLRRGLYLRPGNGNDSLISLYKCNSVSLYKDGRDLDLAVIILNPTIARRMHSETYWLNRSNILDDEESLDDENLIVFGYPREKFALNPASRYSNFWSLLYVTTLYQGERGAWDADEGFYDEYAVDLDFSPGKPRGIHDEKLEQPTPKGLSGGGIWILTDNHENDRKLPVMLVGIEHRWHKTLHSLRGTRIVGLTDEIEPV